MQLEHSFSVPADLDTVWRAVLDPERVAPCMPGATLTEAGESTFAGTVKVKLGPISLLYKGSGEFLETDEQAHRVVIKASGKDSRGNGTAAATVTVTLAAEGSSTSGTVVTDLAITGKPAQFGRGMISEVGGRILDAFAGCLATKLGAAPEAVAEPAGNRPRATGTANGGKARTATAKAAAAEVVAAADAEPDTGQRPQLAVVQQEGDSTAAGNGTQARPRLVAVDQQLETEPIDLLSFAGPSLVKRVVPLVAALLIVLAVVALRRRSR